MLRDYVEGSKCYEELSGKYCLPVEEVKRILRITLPEVLQRSVEASQERDECLFEEQRGNVRTWTVCHTLKLHTYSDLKKVLDSGLEIRGVYNLNKYTQQELEKILRSSDIYDVLKDPDDLHYITLNEYIIYVLKLNGINSVSDLRKYVDFGNEISDLNGSWETMERELERNLGIIERQEKVKWSLKDPKTLQSDALLYQVYSDPKRIKSTAEKEKIMSWYLRKPYVDVIAKELGMSKYAIQKNLKDVQHLVLTQYLLQN